MRVYCLGIAALYAGLMGVGSWWADYLEDISAVYLWQEPGSGGEALVQAVAKDLPQVRIIQAPPGAKDPCELGLSDQDHFVHRLHHLMAEAKSWTEIQQETAAKERQVDYAKAKTLLEDPALLYKFGTAAEGAGLVGERVIALVVYLALKSRVTMRPVNLVIKGPSSSGKSWLVDTVIKFEPEGVVHTFTSHSERALIYSPRSFQNTFIYYQEASGLKQEDGIAAAVVRSIAAKGDIHYEVTVRDPDGSFTTQEIYKPGPVGIILTTVTPQLEEQLETRLLTLETKVEEEQSRAILTGIGLSMNGQQPLEDFSQWHALSRAIEGDDQVDVEFGEWLGQRVGIYGPRVHRDFESLLRLVQASTILYQHQRTRDTHGRILAQVADYAHIHTLLGTMFQSLQREGIAEEDRRLYEAVKELEKENREGPDDQGKPISQSKLANHLEVPRTSVAYRLNKLRSAGFLTNRNAGQRGKSADYRVAEDLPDQVSPLPTPEELAQAFPHLAGIWVNPLTGAAIDLKTGAAIFLGFPPEPSVKSSGPENTATSQIRDPVDERPDEPVAQVVRQVSPVSEPATEPNQPDDLTNEFSEIDQEVVGTSVSDGQPETESIPSIEYVEDEARAREISGALAKVEFVGLDIETTGLDPFMDKIRTVQIATDNAAWVFDIIKVPVTALEAVLSGGPIKVGHNLKFDARFFSVGGVMPEPLFDTMLADQVLHNRGYGRKLQDLAKE